MGNLKGFNIVSGVIFLALTISAVAIIYQTSVPTVERLQTTAAIEQQKAMLSDLDKIIREVAAEGKGSKRTVKISSDPGVLKINGSTNTIIWELETESMAISPRTSQRFGNLVVGSNLESSVSEGFYTRLSPQVPAFIMENEHLMVYINRTNTTSVPISTSGLVLGIYNKNIDSWLDNPGFLEISIDSNEASKAGQGYTQASELGSNLPFGKVKAFLDTTYIDYNIYFILESGSDFIIIEGEEA